MKLFLTISFVLFFGIIEAQVNVYSCSVITNPAVTQAEIDAVSYEFNKACVFFEATSQYQFSGPSNKKVTATTQIHIEEDFHAGPYNSEGGMWLKIDTLCNSNVFATNYMSLDAIEALKKFELGIDLPSNIEQRVQNFIATSDTSIGGGINPYLEWQFNAEAVFTNQATGFTKKVDGFYFQNFERDTLDSNIHNWGWTALPTTQYIRFRYSPEKLGLWDIRISVTLKDGSVYTYCPFTINVVANTSDDAYVKVAPNKRVLQRNGKLFFPIGQNLPWPDDDTGPIGNFSAYGKVHGGSYPNIELNQRMGVMKAEGVDYLRLILNPPSLDIEFEEVGNYTSRLSDGWEIDNIIERAEELNQYIHFDMFIHYSLESQGPYGRIGWDWSDAYMPFAYPRSEGTFGYKNRFGIHDTLPEQFFTNEGCKKYYKQKLRYLISRYGYSTHIALFELMSEVSNAGNVYDDVYDVPNPGYWDAPSLNRVREPYEEVPEHPLRIAWWHDEMAKYIKNELGHKEHLLTVSYGPPIKDETLFYDYSYAIPEIDIMTYNRYSDQLGDKYFAYQKEVRGYTARYDKPMIFSETGPLEEFSCDRNSTYRKDAWMSAFTGVAGFNMWDGARVPEVWHHLANVRSFIEDNQEVADLFMGSWETKYLNDNNNINFSKRKEAVYLVKRPISAFDNIRVGVISNLTDNFYTNRVVSDSVPWCILNITKAPQESRAKQDLNAGDGVLLEVLDVNSAYTNTFDWYNYEGDYISTNNGFPSAPTFFLILNHPLSCATTNCNAKTSEIPFINNWAYVFANKVSIPEDSEPKERVYPMGNNPSQKEEPKKLLLVYPNPSQNWIQIRCTDPSITKFRLVDSKGKIVKVIHNRELKQSINIANLESGIFVILGLDDSNIIKYQQRWVKL